MTMHLPIDRKQDCHAVLEELVTDCLTCFGYRLIFSVCPEDMASHLHLADTFITVCFREGVFNIGICVLQSAF